MIRDADAVSTAMAAGPPMSHVDELRLITRVAMLYYAKRQTQAEISTSLHLSQASVSRLLKRAEKEGIVKISIVPPRGTFPDLEAGLRQRFGLAEAIVAECVDDREETLLASIGDAAAHLLESSL